MRYVRIVAAVILILAGITFIGIVTAQRMSETKNVRDQDATPVEVGVITDAQREHSILYKGMGRRKITDLLEKLGDNAFVRDTLPNRNTMPAGDNGADPLTASAKWTVCHSDSIIVGIVTNKTSQLTEDGYYVFTDYNISLTSYLKGEDTRTDKNNGTITLSEPGGKIKINGRVIRVLNDEHPTLEIGKKYLFPLVQIASSRDFQLAHGSRAVEYVSQDTGGSDGDITDNPSSEDFSPAAQASRIRLWSSEPCSNRKGGREK